MGKFFQALQQAERERALQEHARQHAASLTVAPAVLRRAGETSPLPPSPAREASEPTARGVSRERPTGTKLLTKLQPAAGLSEKSQAEVEEHLVSLLAPTSFGAEQYRALRHRVEQLHRTTNLTVVGISSPESGDGKTITTINLAGALAQASEARVLIVDADLRQSSLAQRLGLDDSQGEGLIGAILDQGLALKDVVEPCPPFNLSILRAGRRPCAPYELLKSPRLGQLLEEARHQYDYVVLDMPPLVPLLDCRVLGRWVDGFLIVVTAHKTRRRMLEEAVKVLDPATIIGLIFNGADQARKGYADTRGRSSNADRAGWRGRLRHGRRPALEGS